MEKQIGIVGGSGFVGQALAELLRAHGCTVRVISRRRLSLPETDYRVYRPEEPASLLHALEGCRAVVNLAGLLNRRLFHPQDFIDVHVRLVERVVGACQGRDVRRYLHLSALNVSADAPSEYLRSKHRGEQIVRSSGLSATLFRPSVIFGPGDDFINRFARLLKYAPGLFPLACPQTRLAPVYIGDLVRLMLEAIEDESLAGQTLSVCGPRSYTLKELVEYTAGLLGRRVSVIPLPDFLARMQARMLEWMPGRPFTMDNYLSLQLDSVCPEKTKLCTSRLEDVVPDYIHGRRRKE